MSLLMKDLRPHRVPIAIVSLIVFSWVSFLLFPSETWNWQPQTTTTSTRDADRRFALVIPANNPSPDLCKTIGSALALGYPSPVIINWGVDHRPISKWKGGKNLPKVPGFVDYLDAVMHPNAHPSERLEEDDIVLLVDAYDVWFQLPAQVMLERYHRLNKEANDRLQEMWNKKRSGKMPMKQTIIAASGKRCDPKLEKMGYKIRCDKWPQSPLRKDLYGPETDKNETWNYYRPRWINGGVYIGPAGDLRRLFRRAYFTMENGIGRGIKMRSEQSLAAEVIVEQEMFRKWQRANKVPKQAMADLMDDKLEYHIGLDYAQELSVQTQWAQDVQGRDNGAFVKLGNQSEIDEYSKERGIQPVRLQGIPEDILSAPNPLADIVPGSNWTNMSLYADFFTESVPVILHHNGVGPLKKHRSTWWDKPWYSEHLRTLLHKRMKATGEPEDPLATVLDDGGRIRYWGVSAEHESMYPREMKKSAKNRLHKMKFSNICQYKKKKADPNAPYPDWWDEVFRDGEGPWGHRLGHKLSHTHSDKYRNRHSNKYSEMTPRHPF
ncbi:hypothetical protein LB507_005053 [Fusarium sp. FIESC RH6]|nr:hypothetical protein LB507_005053 [Fusarium sp. FIESC RH6]